MKKKIGLIVGLIFIGALCFGIMRVVQNPEQYQKEPETVPVVLDCSKFSRISADELKSEWKVEGSNSDNIFTMFGIVPGENAKKTVNTGVSHKFSPVSDKVAEVEFYNYDKENKTFDTVYVTYNLNYFD